MQSTQSAQSWRWPGVVPAEPDTSPDEPGLDAPVRERDARVEVARLQHEIEALVRARGDSPRDQVDSALESVTRMQIVTANVEACGPPPATFVGAAMVALADARLRGHSDAIERGMTYTADNQLQLLRGDR